MNTSSPTNVRVPSVVWSASSRSESAKNAGLGTCVSFYPDENKLVSGSIYGTLNIQDRKTGAVEVFSGHTDVVQEVDVSRDGKMVVSGSNDKTVGIWNGASGERIHVLEGHEHWVLSVGFSPDSSRVVSGSRDRTIRVWSVETGALAFEPIKCRGWVECVRHAPGGDRIASGGTVGDVQIWDARTGVGIRSITDSTVNSLAWTPDGTSVIGGRMGHVTIWCSINGEPLWSWKAHNDWIHTLSISSNGTHLVTSNWHSTTAFVSDILTGERIAALEHKGNVNRIAYSPSGKFIATACDDRTVYLWEAPIIEDLQNQPESSAGSVPSFLDDKSLMAVREFLGFPAEPWRNHGREADQSPPNHDPKASPQPQQRLTALVQEAFASYAEGLSPQPLPALSQTIDKGKGRDPPSALAAGGSDVDSSTAWSLDDIRSNFPHDLTGHVIQEGERPFASGSFGDIYRGTLRMRGRAINVAVKAIRTYSADNGEDAKKKKRFRRELKTWLNLDHINVVPLFGTTINFGQFPAMVCPWLENGSLTSYLERRNDNLTAVERLTLISDVAAGLQYLHSRSVVHGDLSGANVLIHANGKARISDFGLSTLLTQLGGSTFATTHQTPGTLRWTAPELLDLQEHEDEENPPHIAPLPQSDVYSFGRIMLQVLTGKVPYHYFTREAQVVHAMSRGVNPKRPSQELVTDRQWTFIERCWAPVNADQSRPGDEEILEFTKQELEMAAM